MKRYILITIFYLFISQISFSQTRSELMSVQLSATTQTTPSIQITLHWLNDGSATEYEIYRRLNTDDDWAFLASLESTEMSYTDVNVSLGVAFEYRVIKKGSVSGYGYINTAVKLPEVINRGVLIMVVEDTYIGNTDFDNAINQTKQDIENDGWLVQKITVNRNDAVPSVKSSILSVYNQNPTVTKAIYLIGRVPVPYSGQIAPDAHNNHVGAWPSDVFYSDVDDFWGDATVSTTASSYPRNHNIPGDGKYDVSYMNPSIDAELQIGRTDFANMPAFSQTEEELLITYLTKAHSYKSKEFEAIERGLIDDNAPNSGEGWGANGYRNFSTFFTPANINNTDDLRTATSTDSYMWTYGAGSGSFTSCYGIGTTEDFASDSLQTIFMGLFGSYFGDWDSNNNFLRAAIAQGQTLNSFWAGRPNWFVHHMALGTNIGYSSLLTQNIVTGGVAFIDGYWPYGNAASGVHVSLMGDPTVRMHYISPPSNLVIVENINGLDLSWSASSDNILGYNVYRLDENTTSYVKVNDGIISDTNYTDSSIIDDPSGVYTYIVKAVNLKTTASGSYYNLSLGVRQDITYNPLTIDDYHSPEVLIYPNPTTGEVLINMPKTEYNLKATIFNVLGETILVKEYDATNQFSIYVNAKSGIYFLKLESSSMNKIIVKKFIVE